jgi:hypothetical protein
MTGSKSNSNSNSNDEKDHTKINDEIVVDTGAEGPKSKKELRLERKAAKKKVGEQRTPSKPKKEAKSEKETETNGGESSLLLDKEEYIRVKKLQKVELKKEREKLLQKELLEERKMRKRKKLNRELNAKGGSKKKQKPATQTGQPNASAATGDASSSSSKNKKSGNVRDERDISMDAFRSVLFGKGSSTTVGGMTTSRLGVQYENKVVGTGKLVRDGKLITVKYELTGGRGDPRLGHWSGRNERGRPAKADHPTQGGIRRKGHRCGSRCSVILRRHAAGVREMIIL